LLLEQVVLQVLVVQIQLAATEVIQFLPLLLLVAVVMVREIV
jgi:hypothetical protein